jgi:dethiobiotin synthetase
MIKRSATTSYKLNTPASPHLLAEIDGITIDNYRIITIY